MDKGRVIILVGKSGCGKDFYKSRLIESIPSLKEVVTYTTRPPRNGEVDGVNYYFIDKEYMLNMIRQNDVLEFAKYDTVHGEWFYATHIDSFQNDTKDYICILDYKGYERVQKMYPKRTIGFMIHLDKEIRKDNYKRRGGSEEEFDRRELADRYKFEEAENDVTLFHIENDMEDSDRIVKVMGIIINGDKEN